MKHHNALSLLQLCLKVLDTVIAYSCLPSESLHQFTACLCRIVNSEQLCQSSWMVSYSQTVMLP